jgi:hypothetical protein
MIQSSLTSGQINLPVTDIVSCQPYGRGHSADWTFYFLRRDHPGNLIASGGDIDNRIKTLFDSLRMPNNWGEVARFPADADENPFHVLLEDDSQITKVSVTTERLLTPPAAGEPIHDVHLIIGVTVNVLELPQGWGNLCFLGA